MEHFNNLRGVNLYSRYQNVIIVGREQPSTTALEDRARGIWYDSSEPLKLLENVRRQNLLDSESFELRDRSVHLIWLPIVMYLFSHSQSVPFNHVSLLQYFFSSSIKYIGRRQVV